MSKKGCDIHGCEDDHYAKGLCGRHYRAQWREEKKRQPKLQADLRWSRGLRQRYAAEGGRDMEEERRYGLPVPRRELPKIDISRALQDTFS